MGRGDQHVATDLGSYDDAEHWFVRLLDPECSAGERAEFEHWRSADPQHAAAYDEIERLWRQSEEAAKDPSIVAAANRALRSGPDNHVPRRWLYPALAAGFALLLAVVTLPQWLTTPAAADGTRYSTVAGQQQTVPLSDGSSILLDTDTAVTVRYSARTRRVDLLRGQAQFTVQGNHAWPFVVHAGHGTVTAVGTQFQVRLDGDSTDVALLRGKLAVAAESPQGRTQEAALVGGQGLAFGADGHLAAVHAIDVQKAEGWTQGKLFVHDWRLPELLAEMNRYNAVKLEIGDPSLRDIHISGVFRTRDQQTLLQLLQRGWPIHARRMSATQILLLPNR
ncbi:FecR family protein [Dyella jejuensis]